MIRFMATNSETEAIFCFMSSNSQNTAKFGTFKGVFVPSILTILGVIMYLRMGWVVGQVGMVGAAFIITLSSAITFLTGLSIAATATNMKVGGGGAYFMISRSFGIESGAAIGLPLFLAQALGISFYIAGFSESINHLFPQIPAQLIGTASLIALAVLTYISTDLALKAQMGILAVIIASLLSFFMGGAPESIPAATSIAPSATFWQVFAVFFPAVTGIEAGIAMSGDLKNPGRSLPWGTLGAVVTGYFVYLGIAIYLGILVPREILQSNSMIMLEIAKFSGVVLVGIWGASLSSALGALLGAPRTLMALAEDRVLPGLTSKLCEVITYGIALVGIWLGDLNVIAPVLSMFFLTSYGFLNLAAGLEGFISNPSWRPSFRTPWILSFIGAGGCIAAMFMIDAGATFIALLLTFLIYFGMTKRNMKSRWSDIRYSILLSMSRYSIYGLSQLKVDARSWRPNLIVMSGSPQSRWYLVELADAITHGKGFLTVVSFLRSEEKLDQSRIQSMERSVRDFLKKKRVPALIEITSAKNVLSGAEHVVRNYGLGPLVPNTVVIGETEKEERFEDFVGLMQTIRQLKRNLLIIRKGIEVAVPRGLLRHSSRKIDVWWNRGQDNASLMLALGHMIQNSPEWRGAELRLKSVVDSEPEKLGAAAHLEEFVKKGRIDAEVDVYVHSGDPFETIRRESSRSNLVFLGLRPIDDDFELSKYVEYYEGILRKTEGLPPLILTMASEDVEFKEIFNS